MSLNSTHNPITTIVPSAFPAAVPISIAMRLRHPGDAAMSLPMKMAKSMLVLRYTVTPIATSHQRMCMMIGVLTGSANESQLSAKADFIAEDLESVKKLLVEIGF